MESNAPPNQHPSGCRPGPVVAEPGGAAVGYAQLPPELTGRAQWVVWVAVQRAGDAKPTKQPRRAYDPSASASTTDAWTWASFEDALAACRHADGIGFVFTADDGLVGIDLDDCWDDSTDTPAPWASAWIDRFDSYTERSPSGRGVHVLVRGTLPGGRGRKSGQVEVYDRARYFTVTGQRVKGSPPNVERRQDVLGAFLAEYFPTQPQELAPTPPMDRSGIPDDDRELLDRARGAKNGGKFSALYDAGDLTEHAGNHSAADLALCNALAFWTGADPNRIDRLFRGSALMRDKWDRGARAGETYGQGTIQLAIRTAHEHYAGASGRDHSVGASIITAEPAADARSRPGKRPLTDLGNAERFVDMHGPRVLYCASWHSWLVWDGKRFKRDTTKRVWALMADSVRAIYGEAAAEPDEVRRSAIAAWAHSSESRRRHVDALLHTEALLPVEPSDLDTDPWALNTLSGTVNLRTGALRAHSPADRITRMMGAKWDPDAHAPTWEACLKRWLPDDEVRAYVQRVVGVSLIGEIVVHVLMILYGGGANGKSVFMETLIGLFGDYGHTARSRLLLAGRDEGASPEQADLAGRRLVVTQETANGRNLDEATVKSLTGGDRITARHLHQNQFEIDPSWTIWLATNHPPRVPEGGPAIWRRLSLVPFLAVISESDQDEELTHKLVAERDGILAWAWSGLCDWEARGHKLDAPDAVKAATATYRESEDTWAQWFSECCVRDDASTFAGQLYGSYRTWCELGGEKPITQTAFGRKLGDAGMTPDRVRSGRMWQGVRLISDGSNGRSS